MNGILKQAIQAALRPVADYAERNLVFWANTQAMTSAFKRDVLGGKHNIGATDNPARSVNTSDSYKLALFLASATRNASDTVYTTTGELAGTGNYTQGGQAVTLGNPPAIDGTTAHVTPSASVTWTNLTSSGAFDAAVLYNDSHATKYEVSVHTFSSQNITAADFTLTMPTNDGTTGLVRIA
jgi:hypothetical protein